MAKKNRNKRNKARASKSKGRAPYAEGQEPKGFGSTTIDVQPKRINDKTAVENIKRAEQERIAKEDREFDNNLRSKIPYAEGQEPRGFGYDQEINIDPRTGVQITTGGEETPLMPNAREQVRQQVDLEPRTQMRTGGEETPLIPIDPYEVYDFGSATPTDTRPTQNVTGTPTQDGTAIQPFLNRTEPEQTEGSYLNQIDIPEGADALNPLFERSQRPAIDITNEDLYANQMRPINVGQTGGAFFGASNIFAPTLQPDPSYLIASKRAKALEDQRQKDLEEAAKFASEPPATLAPYQDNLNNLYYEGLNRWVSEAQRQYGSQWATALTGATDLGRKYLNWKDNYKSVAENISYFGERFKTNIDAHNKGEITLSDETVRQGREYLRGAEEYQDVAFMGGQEDMAQKLESFNTNINLDREINTRWIKDIKAEYQGGVREGRIDDTKGFLTWYKETYDPKRLRAISESIIGDAVTSYNNILTEEQRNLPLEEQRELLIQETEKRLNNMLAGGYKESFQQKTIGRAPTGEEITFSTAPKYVYNKIQDSLNDAITGTGKTKVLFPTKGGKFQQTMTIGSNGITVRDKGGSAKVISWSETDKVIEAFSKQYFDEIGGSGTISLAALKDNIKREQGAEIARLARASNQQVQAAKDSYVEPTDTTSTNMQEIVDMINWSSNYYGGINLQDNTIIGATLSASPSDPDIQVMQYEVDTANGTFKGMLLPMSKITSNPQLLNSNQYQQLSGTNLAILTGAYVTVQSDGSYALKDAGGNPIEEGSTGMKIAKDVVVNPIITEYEKQGRDAKRIKPFGDVTTKETADKVRAYMGKMNTVIGQQNVSSITSALINQDGSYDMSGSRLNNEDIKRIMALQLVSSQMTYSKAEKTIQEGLDNGSIKLDGKAKSAEYLLSVI